MAYIPVPPDQRNLAELPVETQPFIRRHLLALVIAALTAAFLAAPWSFETKAHAVLHGICGQTPSHTMTLGGMALPLDTRCVGIYGGLLATVLLLIAFGRHRSAALPSTGAGILFLFYLGALAVDGLNSLMTDLGKWHPYPPSNDLRLVTGWLTGVALGSVLVMVTGMSLWRSPKVSMQVLPNWRWAVGLALPCVPALLLLRSDSRFFYYPVSLLLIASAITAFAALAVCADRDGAQSGQPLRTLWPNCPARVDRDRCRDRPLAGFGGWALLARISAALAVSCMRGTIIRMLESRPSAGRGRL